MKKFKAILFLTLSRVWDKVISGSCKILVFVAIEILLTFKMKLMALNSAEKIAQFLENVSILGILWCVPRKAEGMKFIH